MTTYQVGKFYTVRVAVLSRDVGYFKIGNIVPVMGEMHSDKEIIGFVPDHVHIDWRFVGPRHFYDYAGIESNEYKGRELGAVMVKTDISHFETRKLKMKREMNLFPSKRAPWFSRLVDAYKHTVAKNGRCPHKGYDMTTLPVDKDNCVTCPLHGLKWNAQTWALIPQ